MRQRNWMLWIGLGLLCTLPGRGLCAQTSSPTDEAERYTLYNNTHPLRERLTEMPNAHPMEEQQAEMPNAHPMEEQQAEMPNAHPMEEQQTEMPNAHPMEEQLTEMPDSMSNGIYALPIDESERKKKERARKEKKFGEKKINFGFKGGFTSSLFIVSDLSFGDYSIEEYQNNYRIGYFASLFMRINSGRHFFQPEISYCINRSNITFPLPSSESSTSSARTTDAAGILTGTGAPSTTRATTLSDNTTVFVESDIHSIDIPLLYGWNIIKEYPYSLAIFGGPKLRYIWGRKSHTNFNNLSREEMREKLYPFNIGLSLGVAVTISPIFFDFRYDIGINNLSKQVNYTPTNLPQTETPSAPSIRFKHRDNVLSFSIGACF